MRIKVKTAFPYSLTEILKERGISPKLAKEFIRNFPADYKKGAVHRYIRPPELGEAYKLILSDGQPKAVPLFSHPSHIPIYTGTQEQCQAVIRDALRRWWSLPKGKELETVIQEHIEQRKAAKEKKRAK